MSRPVCRLLTTVVFIFTAILCNKWWGDPYSIQSSLKLGKTKQLAKVISNYFLSSSINKTIQSLNKLLRGHNCRKKSSSRQGLVKWFILWPEEFPEPPWNFSQNTKNKNVRIWHQIHPSTDLWKRFKIPPRQNKMNLKTFRERMGTSDTCKLGDSFVHSQ